VKKSTSYSLIPILVLVAVAVVGPVWALTAKAVSKVVVTDYSSADDEAVNLAFTESQSVDFANGTGAGNANEAWIDSRALSASTSEELDLAGGLTRAGYAYTFTKVKVLRVEAASTNAEDIEVGGADANQFVGPFGDSSDTVGVPPGGFVTFVHPGAGWNVAAGTGDLLKVLAGAAGGTYRITVVGEASKS